MLCRCVGRKWLFWFCSRIVCFSAVFANASHLLKGWLCAVGAKANVPFAGRHKIELKKMCGWENKKYRRVGNECRLTRCPFEIWFLCLCSPVKMVTFCLCLGRLVNVPSVVLPLAIPLPLTIAGTTSAECFSSSLQHD